jgi:hypothetical protein
MHVIQYRQSYIHSSCDATEWKKTTTSIFYSMDNVQHWQNEKSDQYEWVSDGYFFHPYNNSTLPRSSTNKDKTTNLKTIQIKFISTHNTNTILQIRFQILSIYTLAYKSNSNAIVDNCLFLIRTSTYNTKKKSSNISKCLLFREDHRINHR